MKFDQDLPFVTIAVPAFNHEGYITQCLESAAAQSYPNLDLVVIDDGSADRTFARIDDFVAAHRDRFRTIHADSRANKGVAATCNELFARSETEWVFATASDDLMYPDRVRFQMDAIRRWAEPDLAIVYGGVDWIGPDGESVAPVVDERYEPGVRRDMYLDFLVANPPHGACQTFRREAILAVGGYDESLPMEDFYMSLELSLRFPMGFLEEKLGAYRRHGGNLSLQHKTPKMVGGLLEATANFLEKYPQKIPHEVRRKVYRKNLLRTIRCLRRYRLSALTGLVWELLRFDASRKSPADLRRYAALIRRATAP